MKENNQLAHKMPLLSGSSVSAKRSQLKLYFNQTWALYESLFSTINADEAFYLRPEPLRHPLIFYFGHTATFFINKLRLGKFIDQRVNEHIESICAIGVDEMSWDDLNTDHYDWPTVDQVKAYRHTVNQLINDLIDNMTLTLPISSDSLAWLILMGIEHERIHVETSSVIMRMLPLHYLNQHPQWQACLDHGQAPLNQLVDIAAEQVTLGKPASDDTYGWDNEYGTKTVAVAAFKASQYLVSNQEFLAFVEQGGYQNSDYWTEEGRHWLAFSQATMPRFWFKQDNQYYQRNLLTEIKLPLNWPVEINYLEAKAFCNWKSAQTDTYIRLPTEPEWFVLRNTLGQNLPHWPETPGNINLAYYASPCPVDRFEHQGLFDIVGNVWQWTESPFDGFNGFKVHPLYDDFSTPTFDGKHNLIKGGSWISTGNEAQQYARYAFRRHFFQHAGFRYVESAHQTVPIDKVNSYESLQPIAQQLAFNYGDLQTIDPTVPDASLINRLTNDLAIGNYAAMCVNQLIKFFDGQATQSQRALDLGCSVGRSSFELAQHFGLVDAIDLTAQLIQHAFQMQEQGECRYTLKAEGEIMNFTEISIRQQPFWTVKDKVNFSQGDACNLKPRYQGYDLIFAANLLERLYDPVLFLNQIHQRLNNQGYLVLTSCYDWSEQEKLVDSLLGGVKVNGENFNTLAAIEQLLTSRFELIQTVDIPYVLRTSNRQSQLNSSQMSVWRLR